LRAADTATAASAVGTFDAPELDRAPVTLTSMFDIYFGAILRPLKVSLYLRKIAL
jgi:hypothetical protein